MVWKQGSGRKDRSNVNSPGEASSENLVDHLPLAGFHQRHLLTVGHMRKRGMIQPHLVQQCRVEVVLRDDIFHRSMPEFIGRAMHVT